MIHSSRIPLRSQQLHFSSSAVYRYDIPYHVLYYRVLYDGTVPVWIRTGMYCTVPVRFVPVPVHIIHISIGIVRTTIRSSGSSQMTMSFLSITHRGSRLSTVLAPSGLFSVLPGLSTDHHWRFTNRLLRIYMYTLLYTV